MAQQMPWRVKDLTGQRFGRLIVRRFVRVDHLRRANWECACDCGGSVVAAGVHLVQGDRKSCGCLHEAFLASNHRHGQAAHGAITREYVAWRSMMQRCEEPSHKDYPRYGGAGIRVCDRWKNFENFRADMGPKPSKDHSLDRIKNQGGYEPGNVRWATRVEQQNNKRDNARVTLDGVTRTVTEWCRLLSATRTDVPRRGLVYQRLKAGWPPEQVFAPPLQRGRMRDTHRKGVAA